MSDLLKRRSAAREERPPTRFDRSRRNVLIAIALLAVALVLSGVAGLAAQAGRRNTPATPRYIDIWAVYPDASLRAVTIFHPPQDFSEALVEVAGPLVASEEDILSSEAFGGEVAAQELLPGPGQDSHLLYPRLTLARAPEADGAPYGVDVRTRRSPYLIPDPLLPNALMLALGVKSGQGYFRQVVVAVALPLGTTAVTFSDMQPYREAKIGGWQVYYFDTTEAQATDAIRVSFRLPEGDAPPDLDYWRVEQER